MNTHTDSQLQLALAKMLPEVLTIDHLFQSDETKGSRIRWLYDSSVHFKRKDLKVEDTEWLHVCWLVEETLTNDEMDTYDDIVWDNMNTTSTEKLPVHATYQQRAIALAKVKGVEIV